MRDKAAGEMLSALLGLVDALVCTQASEPRSFGAEELADLARARRPGVDVRSERQPATAVDLARRLAGARGSVLVTGSLYLLADLSWLIVGHGPEV